MKKNQFNRLLLGTVVSTAFLSYSFASETLQEDNCGFGYSNALRLRLQGKKVEITEYEQLPPAEKFVRLAIEMILESLRLGEMEKAKKEGEIVNAETALNAGQEIFADLIAKESGNLIKEENNKEPKDIFLSKENIVSSNDNIVSSAAHVPIANTEEPSEDESKDKKPKVTDSVVIDPTVSENTEVKSIKSIDDEIKESEAKLENLKKEQKELEDEEQKILERKNSRKAIENTLKGDSKLKAEQSVSNEMPTEEKDPHDKLKIYNEWNEELEMQRTRAFLMDSKVLDPLNPADDTNIQNFNNILKEIEGRRENKIIGLNKIYEYDPNNETNLHKYIDGKENIIIIIRLSNGNVLGAYSEGAFCTKRSSYKDGMIFSVTNNITFEPKEKNITKIIYDEYYLIFGNAEIRIKTQENKVFSNFDISGSYYDPRRENVNILLGDGKEREVGLASYEIYKLGFKNEENIEKLSRQYQSIFYTSSILREQNPNVLDALKKELESKNLDGQFNKRLDLKLKNDKSQETYDELKTVPSERKIKKIEILYDTRYDLDEKGEFLNKTNFHEYFDNKQHIGLAIKLPNDYTIGAYFDGMFNKNGKVDNALCGGFLFSINTNKEINFFYSKTSIRDGKLPNIPIYLSNSIRFGGPDLEITKGENKVFSSFGKPYSYFDNKRCKIEDFWGYGPIDIDLNKESETTGHPWNYQIFQVHYEGEDDPTKTDLEKHNFFKIKQ